MGMLSPSPPQSLGLSHSDTHKAGRFGLCHCCCLDVQVAKGGRGYAVPQAHTTLPQLGRGQLLAPDASATFSLRLTASQTWLPVLTICLRS